MPAPKGYVRTGDRTERVTLMRPVVGTDDAYGQAGVTHVPVATLWAEVEDLASREFWFAQQVAQDVTKGVVIPNWDSDARPRLTSAWQLKWRGVTLEIAAPPTIDTSGRQQQLQCREVVPPVES